MACHVRRLPVERTRASEPSRATAGRDDSLADHPRPPHERPAGAPLTYRNTPFISAREAPRARWRRVARVTLRLLVIAVIVGLLLPLAGVAYLGSQIPRADVSPSWSGVGVFAADRDRSDQIADATNILLAGTSGGAALENLAILHVSGERERPVAVLLPPELAVEVPGTGHASLASAWADEGPDVLVEAVAGYASLDISRYVEVDLEELRPLSFLVATEACFGPDLVGSTASALTTEAPRHPIRAWRTVREARTAFAVDQEAGRTEVLRAIWSLRTAPEDLDVIVVPTRETEGELRALLEPTEIIFQALRAGDELPPADEIVPEVVRPEDVEVTVLNGAGVSGVAGATAEALEEVGFGIVEVGNAPSFDVEVTEVHQPAESEEAAGLVAAHLPGAEIVPLDDPDGSVVVVVGEDRVDDPALAEVVIPERHDPSASPSACW